MIGDRESEVVMPAKTKAIDPVWKCEGCGYVGQESEFRVTPDSVCPECDSEDIFPYRMYRCKGCGKVADQHTWFEEAELDLDPIALKIPAKPCDKCTEKWEERHRLKGKATQEEWREYRRLNDEAASAPAILEEVPVNLPARAK